MIFKTFEKYPDSTEYRELKYYKLKDFINNYSITYKLSNDWTSDYLFMQPLYNSYIEFVMIQWMGGNNDEDNDYDILFHGCHDGSSNRCLRAFTWTNNTFPDSDSIIKAFQILKEYYD